MKIIDSSCSYTHRYRLKLAPFLKDFLIKHWQSFLKRFFNVQVKIKFEGFTKFFIQISISSRTVPSAIWQVFYEFLLFWKLVSRAFRRVKYLPILREANV